MPPILKYDDITVFIWHRKNTMNMGKLLNSLFRSGIKNVLSETNKGYRGGGDEFVIITEKTEIVENLGTKKEELENNMKEIPAIKNNIVVAVGYTYGNGNCIKELIKEADQKMYEDKRILKHK